VVALGSRAGGEVISSISIDRGARVFLRIDRGRGSSGIRRVAAGRRTDSRPCDSDSHLDFSLFFRIEPMTVLRQGDAFLLAMTFLSWAAIPGCGDGKPSRRYLADRGNRHRSRHGQGVPVTGGTIAFNPSNSGRIVARRPRSSARRDLHDQDVHRG